jgi:hypothetical protein
MHRLVRSTNAWSSGALHCATKDVLVLLENRVPKPVEISHGRSAT